MNLALTLLLLIVGGSLGALARFLSQRLAATYTSLPGWIPVLIINVLGSIIIGAAVAFLSIDIKDLHLADLTPMDQDMLKLPVCRRHRAARGRVSAAHSRHSAAFHSTTFS